MTFRCSHLAIILLVCQLVIFGQRPFESSSLSPSPTPKTKASKDGGIGLQRENSENNSSVEHSREAKPELVLQTGYNNLFGATRLVFSPDTRLLATGTIRSSTIKLWEIATGRELRNLSAGNQRSVENPPFVAFSADSRLLAATGEDNSVKIWDVTSGRELQKLVTSRNAAAPAIDIYYVAFRADGRIVTISDVIKIWDPVTGRELRSIDLTSVGSSGFRREEGSVALSPDGSHFAAVVKSNLNLVIKFWDLNTGQEVRSVNLPEKEINRLDLEFGPVGQLIVTAIVNQRVMLWDVRATVSGRVLGSTSQDHGLVKLSRDGRLLAVLERYKVKIWNASTGRELPKLNLPQLGLSAAEGNVFLNFSEDGKKIATGGFDTQTIVWETETGKQLLRMSGRTNMAYKVSFSRDGGQLFSGGSTGWDLHTGRGLRLIAGQAHKTLTFPSSDGTLLAGIMPESNVVSIIEASTGRQLRSLTPATEVGSVRRASFSIDGRLLVTSYGLRNPAVFTSGDAAQQSNQNQLKIWDVASGRELHTFLLESGPIEFDLSRDGGLLTTLDAKGQITIWNATTGIKLRTLTNPSLMGQMLTSIAFSPDGQTIATGGHDPQSHVPQALATNDSPGKNRVSTTASEVGVSLKNTTAETSGSVVLWDVTTGNAIGVLSDPGKEVIHIAFSRDGRLLASSSSDNTLKIWDLATRREIRTLTGHTSHIESMDFSPDSRLLASADDDGGTFLWDLNTGEHLLTLISLDDGGEWIAITPQGLFDGTPISWNQILWRYNQDTFNVAPIEWFFNEFYYPGLLAEVFAGKRPHVDQDVSKKDRRQPLVTLSLADRQSGSSSSDVASRKVKLKIEVRDAPADKENPQGSGARDLRLFRNGSLIRVWHGDVLKGEAAVTLEEEIAVVAGANRLTAYTFNKDNVKSKDAQLSLAGADNLRRSGTAHIIVIGINEYSNSQYNLKYAVADAQSFSEAVRQKLSRLSRFERIEVVPLLNEDATKSNILAVLRRFAGSPILPTLKASLPDRLKRVEPEDTVIVYYAGHGTSQAQQFYLIPHDIGYTGERTRLDEQGLQMILSHSISDADLEAAVEGLDADHLLLIIDACNSGQALEAEEKRRGPMNSKGLAQLAYEKGMYILTAAQSYQAALEAAQLGHGLLTYALVEEGLKTLIADNEPRDGVVSAREWLDFATERVPQIQKEKMKGSRGLGIAFTEGEENVADPERRSVQRPRVFYRRELEANPLVIVRSTGSQAFLPASTATSIPVPTGRFSRWVDVQTATLGLRYIFIQNNSGLSVANQLQDLVQFKSRFKFDTDGNYSINAGVFTGNSFTAGFNPTGIGSGHTITNLYLKQLYLSAKPYNGFEAQFGGLYFNRGQSTEITTYDNDGYLMGERVIVQRPRKLFFDEISATYAFLGDFSTPNVNKRWRRLEKSNYHQFLVSKKIGERATVSGDYTFQFGSDTLRQAVRLNTPEFKPIDFLRIELYERVTVNPHSGFAASGEKAFMNKRLTIGGGYAQIDRDYGGLNADRFNRGRRFFFSGTYNLTPEFTLTTFYTRAINNNFPISNRTRFEVMFSYNLLKSLQKAKIF